MTRLDLVVGSNGSGKSTFVEFVLAEARPNTAFVNAHLIAADRWPDDPEGHASEAATAAEAARNELLANGTAFMAETVASHPSKVDLVRRANVAGYHVHVIVVAVPEEPTVQRVRATVDAGGHDVPEAKIRSRYKRLWANVVEMIRLADSAEVFDNSGGEPTTSAVFAAGRPVAPPRWPAWIPTDLSGTWP